MSLDRDDIRAAVAAGMVTEAQAASLVALAERRRGLRENAGGLDEPFELFRGFNEVFIVVGLTILYSGWMGVIGLANIGTALTSARFAGVQGLALCVLTLGGLALLGRYFTLRRRMIAPSIALTAMVALTGLTLGLAVAGLSGLGAIQERVVASFGSATLVLAGWYALYRVPFTVALIALGAFVTIGAVFVLRGAGIPGLEDLFLLSADGPFALLTVALGALALGLALWFDMSDPHRVTRRAASGFWLHLVAAPAIVNTVALTLLEIDSPRALIALFGFLAVLAVFAVAIDRRSFLVAGVGYVVALSALVLEDNTPLAILALGLALVLLGAQWERMRRGLMRALPRFPGKDRLPPWDLIAEKDSA